MKFAIFFSITAAGLTSVAAASLRRAEQGSCPGAIQTILSSPGSECLAPAALQALITAQTPAPQALDTWLNQMCALPPCSPDILARVAPQITAGCGSSLNTISITSGATLVSNLTANYPVYRDIFCLRNSTANAFCLTQRAATLTFTQDPVNGVEQLIANAIGNDCTNCTRAAVQLLSHVNPNATLSVNPSCGTNFTDTIHEPAFNVAQAAVSANLTDESQPNGGSRVGPAATTLLLTGLVAFLV